MIRKFTLVCLAGLNLLMSIKVSAQAPPDTSTTQKLLTHIFQPVDKAQIPGGFLEEFGCPIIPMATFNGTLTDSNRIDMNLWRTLYFQLQTSWTKTTTNPLPTIASVNTGIRGNLSGSVPVLIPLIIGQYNTVKSNAFSSNLLYRNLTTNQIGDVSGRSQSPYESKNLFAGCPVTRMSMTGYDSFIIRQDMIWNNTSKSIGSIQIDFANGEGFKTVALNSPIGVSYIDTGMKRWTLKATLSDNSILRCYSDFYVARVASLSARYQANESVLPPWGFVGAINGVRSNARVTINYSKNNFSGTLRKPLVVIEGYDISGIAPALGLNYSAADFIDALRAPGFTGYDFRQQLDDIAGYDLVFVDFGDGAADILLNAGTVQEVINRVNANKVNDNRFGGIRQQNVVMGLSMGGLCARYALANMTKNFSGTPTETRLLITHDSPHQGANVPLGLQYLIRMVGGAQLFNTDIRDIYPDYNDVIGLLDAPATQQMLTYRSLTATTFASNNFLSTTYRSMVMFGTTGPQPTYRFVATSLGSECATQLYNPYQQLLNVSLDGFIFYFPIVSYRLRTIVETFALPATGSTSKIARFKLSSKFKLFGLITISKDFFENTAYAPGSHLAVDGVPGGITEYASTVLPSVKQFFPIIGVLNFIGYVSANASGTPGKFSFVSTASALDAGPYTSAVFSQKYVNGTNQNYPSRSQTFIAQETVSGNPASANNIHIRFTARNSQWMFNEMENLPNLLNCSSECSNPFTIVGPNSLCTPSAQYTITDLPRGATVNWTISHPTIGTVQNVNQAGVVTKVGNGLATLTANFQGCVLNSLSKQVMIGTPNDNIIFSVAGPTTFCPNQMMHYSATTNSTFLNQQNLISYSWQWPSGWVVYAGGPGYNFIDLIPTSSPGQIVVRASSTCGMRTNGPIFARTLSQYCGGFFKISPNPVSNGELVISSSSAAQESKTTENIPVIKEIKITNMEGVIMLSDRSPRSGSQARFNVETLKNGTYVVSIFDGQVWQSQSVIIMRN